MAHCENCGTKMSDGLCPNCEEEAVIIETQGDVADGFSDQFRRKADDQFAARKRRAMQAGPVMVRHVIVVHEVLLPADATFNSSDLGGTY